MRLPTAPFAVLIAMLGCILAPVRASGAADLPPAALAEIHYLLATVGASGCEFFRNGTWHDAHQAQTHLSEKYQSLLDRGRLRTAEDFIELAATRSSLTAQPYAVRCAGQAPVSSNSWLTGQLRRYRDTAGTPHV